jgi:hypothetical protein
MATYIIFCSPFLFFSSYRHFTLGPNLSYDDFCHAHGSTEDTQTKLDFQVNILFILAEILRTMNPNQAGLQTCACSNKLDRT